MNIQGERIILRAIEAEDLPLIVKWYNDPSIASMLGGWKFPVSLKKIEGWFQGIQGDDLNQRFAIQCSDLGLIGTANLVEINWKDRTATHGILLGEQEFRGKGYATETVLTLMRYAFEELGLYRLDSTIISSNTSSLRLYLERCGWKEEGRLRGWYWRNGKRWDKVMIGVTIDDYRALQQV